MRQRHPTEWIRRRLLAKAKRNLLTGCLEWQGSKSGAGYGRLWDGERLQYTHRLAYQAFVGLIPESMDILHHCDNPCCIEPLDLWPGTHQDNMRDKDAKGRGGAWKLKDRKRGPSLQRGEQHALAKLTRDKVLVILASPHERGTTLAAVHGISTSSVYAIRKGKLWAWLKAETEATPST